MKAIKLFMAITLLGSFVISPKTERAKKLEAMQNNTIIVEKNDNNCSSLNFVTSLYKRNNQLVKRYKGEKIMIYQYHELCNGLSHNEIEVNLSSYTYRYDF